MRAGGRGESSRLSLFSTHYRPLPQITLDFFSRPPYYLKGWHRLILAKKEEFSDISGLNQAINSICCLTYKLLPFCNNQSILHLGSFKPNMILGLSKGLLKESKQPRLTLTNLTTGAKKKNTRLQEKKKTKENTHRIIQNVQRLFSCLAGFTFHEIKINDLPESSSDHTSISTHLKEWCDLLRIFLHPLPYFPCKINKEIHYTFFGQVHFTKTNL